MSNVAVADINVAEIMSHEDNQNAAVQMMAVLESKPIFNQMLEAARSAEEIYESLKEYISLKLEDFKIVLAKAFDFISSPKARLEDDMLDDVSGGFLIIGSLILTGIFVKKIASKVSSKIKDVKEIAFKAGVSIAVIAGMIVFGASTGAALGSKLC